MAHHLYDPEGPLFPAPDADTGAEADRFAQEIERRRRGEISEEEFRRFRLQHGVYGIRGEVDVQLIRVKVPYGVLSAPQVERLGAIAEAFTPHGIGHLTTRQCIQFHRIPLGRIPEVLRRLAEVGLTSREACGHTVRNVTGCPLAGICREEVFDIRPHAAAFVLNFLRNPANQNLPRKFKAAFSGCGRDCAGSGFHDLGAVAAVREVDGRREPGFRVYVGGGLGSHPKGAHLLEEFTPAGQLIVTTEAILRVFDRFGNREELHRARLKFLIESLGVEEFRRRVFQERRILAAIRPGAAGGPPLPAAAEEDGAGTAAPGARQPLPPDADPYRLWLATNAVAQRQKGFHAVRVTVPGGDLTADQLRALARAARRYADGRVHTTITQDALFHWVRERDLPDLYGDLAEAGLGLPGADRVVNVVGCPGAETCNLAVTRSHRLALELTRQLSERPEYGLADDLRDVAIRVSGCPNSCGHHHVGTIGLHGAARKIGDRQVPYYQLLLGGEPAEGRIAFGRPVMKLPAKKVPEAIFRLFDLYRAQRHEGETFLAWVRRLENTDGDGEADLETAAGSEE